MRVGSGPRCVRASDRARPDRSDSGRHGPGADRVRAGAVEAGRDPNKLEIITKVRVSLHPDRAVARSSQCLIVHVMASKVKGMCRETLLANRVAI